VVARTAQAITGVVEGDLDEAVLRRVVACAGLSLGRTYGRKGKPFLLQSIDGYNNAARFFPWIVLIDLDGDCDCAPECIEQWLPDPAPHMCLRVAVRAIEAWVLADRERIANWLGVPAARIPENPDRLDDPKRRLIDLARSSRRRALRDDLVPREGSGREVGALYTARMTEFVQDENDGWRPDLALRVSDSLRRCIAHVQKFADAPA
jgi:hypothetical protein